jgi:hypothetical protein
VSSRISIPSMSIKMESRLRNWYYRTVSNFTSFKKISERKV